MEFPALIQNLPSETHEFLSYRLDAKNCDVFFSEIEANTFISEHEHEVTVLNIVIAGSITVVLNGKTKTFVLGEWCEIPAHTRHSLQANEKSRLIEFWFK